ncbi:MAG: 4Fe-4S dicluster domain-containing protein, partial [Gammaproteobacteria bacterium]
MPITFPDFPLADADKCVKCALCLPHCPTWRETRNEAESPRGRIALMQGFATGALEITPRLAAHLNQCLGCRACEAVCPAEVPYGKLIDAAHATLQTQGQHEGWLARALAW